MKKILVFSCMHVPKYLRLWHLEDLGYLWPILNRSASIQLMTVILDNICNFECVQIPWKRGPISRQINWRKLIGNRLIEISRIFIGNIVHHFGELNFHNVPTIESKLSNSQMAVCHENWADNVSNENSYMPNDIVVQWQIWHYPQ